MSNILEQIQSLATLENAKAWQADDEKALFCSHLFEANDIRANLARIEVLETFFEKALEDDEFNKVLAKNLSAMPPSNRWP